MIEIVHDSHSLEYRSPFGAVESGSSVELKLKIKTDRALKKVYTVGNRDGEAERHFEMELTKKEDGCEVYSYKLYTSDYKGLIWYRFEVHSDDGVYYYGNSHDGLGGRGTMYIYDPKDYQITVYSPELEVPEWYKEGIIYQIFPDRFRNGNPKGKVNRPNRDMILRSDWKDDPQYFKGGDGKVVYYDYFGGNLLGVIEKLDYLEMLNVTIIYLNPIFEAESNHKYDTGDYLKIDKMFGDEEIFKELCREAKSRGISIILDGVFSHTGSDSIYFNKLNKYGSVGAYQSKDSKYYSWYRFDEYPEKYDSWWGIDVLPNVNEEEPSYSDFIIGKDGVIEKWIKLGAKGWRLDVADELPDSFIKSLRKKMKEIDPEAVLVGEVWEDASNKISYGKRREYLYGEELDSTMNYPFRDNAILFIMDELDAYGLHRRVMSLYENYPRENFYGAMNLVGTHDSERIIYALGRVPNPETMSEDEKKNFRMNRESKSEAVERLKLISLMQMTFPGVPSIYYGDEVGLEGYRDPYNRRTYPWGHEDRCILEWYRKISCIRSTYSVFRRGNFTSIPINKDVYSYIREGDGCGIVVINRGQQEQTVEIDLSDYGADSVREILKDEECKIEDGVLKLKLEPRGKKVFICKKQAR